MSEGSPTERFGPYLVYEQLGVGGMAQVHRAVAANSTFQRPVALKRMLSHIAGSHDMVRSFVREARLASHLRHENVAQTYDLGRVGDVYFIVMELVTGRNLREVLRHCGGTTGPMPVPIALNILNQICDALDYAHNLRDDAGEPLGIIHRDVSPSNVIVSDAGVVKLIDFGIAKTSGAGMQTMSGTLKGKYAYMAPEYLGGRLDARADLFAVGVIAHELLTNRPLFSGRDDIDTLSRVRNMQIAPPSHSNPQVPPEIDDIVMTALARDPERRWQHATALRTALTTLTRRLGLIATNTQVIQWLDWAFCQPRKKASRAATDQAAELVTLDTSSQEPSISIELQVDAASSSQRITTVKHGSELERPTKTPVGTPAFPSPASPLSLAEMARAAAEPGGHHPTFAAREAPGAAVPRRSSTSSPAALPLSALAANLPPLAANGRTFQASSAPPPKSFQAPSPRAVQGSQVLPTSALVANLPPLAVSARTFPASSAPPPRSFQPPQPAVQGSQPLPAPQAPGAGQLDLRSKTFLASPAPAPHSLPVPSSGPQAVHGSPVPVVQSVGAPRPVSPFLSVARVLLAAAIAAITVYFVLPLFT